MRGSPVDPGRTTTPATGPEGAPTTGTGLQVALLGPLEVRVNGVRISDRAWRTSKASELLVLLVLDRDRAVSRDALIEALWPDSDLGSAVSNFHFTLHSLRKALSSAPGAADSVAVVRRDRGYQLVTPGRIAADVDLFRLLMREAQDFQRYARIDDAARLFRAATLLYRGDFAADLQNAWLRPHREELTRQLLSALRQLAEIELERGDPLAAVPVCERFLRDEPYDENVHRLLLRAYHEAGDQGLVTRHYQALVALLRRELNEEPEAATVHLYERLRAGAPRRPGHRGAPAPLRLAPAGASDRSPVATPAPLRLGMRG